MQIGSASEYLCGVAEIQGGTKSLVCSHVLTLEGGNEDEEA